MRITQDKDFELGYTEITALDGIHSEMMMDFGVLRLNTGMEFADDKQLERVFVLLYGEIEVTYDGQTIRGKRETYTNDTIWCVNLPKNVPVVIRGVAEDSHCTYGKRQAVCTSSSLGRSDCRRSTGQGLHE